MVVATVLSGFFMSAVHMVVSKPMEESEYGVFFTLLRVFLIMGIPAGGLQTVFAQDAAASLREEHESALSAAVRAVCKGSLVAWMIMAGVVFLISGPVVEALKIRNPAALWVTVSLGLASLWLPILRGILQGRQNFFGLGWVIILDGVGRFSGIVVVVLLGGQAAGAMTGALVGQATALGVGAWMCRDVLLRPAGVFRWRPWLKRVMPLTLGVALFLVMTNMDVIFVQWLFPKERSILYMPAAMIGLAMVTFTTPLAAVMFPKLVHSAARTERTDVLKQALGATALLGGLAAVACTLLPELPLRIIYFRNPTYWQAAPLIPWMSWCLLPLIVGNVLIGNHLARGRFESIPWLSLVVLAYVATLFGLSEKISAMEPMQGFRTIIQTLGGFNLALLCIAAWFTGRSAPGRH
jgi:O-antigen/teichoic acid export membrane protein